MKKAILFETEPYEYGRYIVKPNTGKIEPIIVLNEKIAVDLTKDQTEPQGGTPEWYTEGIQPNEYIQMKLSKRTNLDPYEGYLLGQIIKYASRCDLKDEKGKDAVKIQYYATKLLEYQDARKEK